MSDDEFDDEQPLNTEYNDELSDDELEERLKTPAHDALERLRARERPTEADVKCFGPLYQKLADQERVPFLIVQDSIVLGFNGILYPYYQGGDYVRQLVIDESIPAIELDSDGWVGSGGLLYSGDREGDYEGYYEGYDDDDGNSWETPNQQAGYEEIFNRSQLRLMLAEVERLEAKIEKLEAAIKKLEGRGETVETNQDLASYKQDLASCNQELAFYKKELGLTTYQGRIQSADSQGRKIQQRVFHNIHNWYKKMEGEEYGTDESRIIMAYFRKYIITGRTCYHTGPWKFKCF